MVSLIWGYYSFEDSVLNPIRMLANEKLSVTTLCQSIRAIRGRLAREPPRITNHSAFKYEVIDPILMPALVVFLSTEWFFFTVADGVDAIGGNALLHQCSFHRFRPAGSESDVVFLRSAVVAVSFHQNFDIR